MIEEEKKAKILEMTEYDSYFLIDECGAFMFRMNHDMAHDRIPQESHAEIQEDINNVGELQKFVVDNLTRFSIDPESAKDRENGEYWKWYRFWDSWKKGLSDEDWDTMTQLMSKEESIEKYLPWNKFYRPDR